ncbi:FeoB-associated Cys-rich membrane protein [Mariniphaga sp.]
MWELQNILVYIIVLAALFFLVKKFILKKKKPNAKGCDSACNCH